MPYALTDVRSMAEVAPPRPPVKDYCDFGRHVEVHRVERQHTVLSMIKEPIKMNPTLAVTLALTSVLILKLPETLACGQLQTDRAWKGPC